MCDPSTQDAWLRRIHALLAKAASTEYPEEAEALLAKAQELMARHAIDDAMLQAADPSRRAEVTTTTIVVEPPYVIPKATLLGAVAKANHCQVVIVDRSSEGGRCYLIGYASDVEMVSLLYAGLSLQATRSLLAAPTPRDGVRRFRHAFLLAYAYRISERLRDAQRIARAEAETTGQSVELALLDRTAAVDKAVAEAFPLVRTLRQRASSHSGMVSGRAAADTADLGQRRLPADRPRIARGLT